MSIEWSFTHLAAIFFPASISCGFFFVFLHSCLRLHRQAEFLQWYVFFIFNVRRNLFVASTISIYHIVIISVANHFVASWLWPPIRYVCVCAYMHNNWDHDRMNVSQCLIMIRWRKMLQRFKAFQCIFLDFFYAQTFPFHRFTFFFRFVLYVVVVFSCFLLASSCLLLCDQLPKESRHFYIDGNDTVVARETVLLF